MIVLSETLEAQVLAISEQCKMVPENVLEVAIENFLHELTALESWEDEITG